MLDRSLALVMSLSLALVALGEMSPSLPGSIRPQIRAKFDPGITSALPTTSVLPRVVPRQEAYSSSLGMASSTTMSPANGASTSSVSDISLRLDSSSSAHSAGASSSASAGSSSASGYALQLAQALLGSSTPNCTATGGGCAVLNMTLAQCRSDTDACQNEVTLAAMVCAQCNLDQTSIDKYNTYLSVCQAMGVAKPSSTLEVPIIGLSAGSSAMASSSVAAAYSASMSSSTSTGLLDMSSSSSSTQRSASLSSTSSVVGPAGAQLTASPSVGQDLRSSASASSGVLSSTVASASSSSKITAIALLATDMVGSSAAASAIDLPSSTVTSSMTLAGAVGIGQSSQGVGVGSMVDGTLRYESYTLAETKTSMTAITLSPSPVSMWVSSASASAGMDEASGRLNQSLLALNAAIGFFSYEIDAKCDSECSTWKGLSSTCIQDLCICTDPGVLSAAACSSCLGSTTHGEQYQQQISYYSAFTANCSAEVSGLSPSVVGASNGGYDIVAVATSRASARSSLTSQALHGTAAGAEEAVVTVTKSSRGKLDAGLPGPALLILVALAVTITAATT